MRHLLWEIALVGIFCAGSLALCQQLPRPANLMPVAYTAPPSYSNLFASPAVASMAPAPSLSAPVFTFQPVMIKPVSQPCAKFVEPFDVDDYSGPMHQVIARISQRVDGATVKAPRRHSLKP